MKDLKNKSILILEKGFNMNTLVVKYFLFSITQNIFETILK